MKDYVIVTDSTTDLPIDVVNELGVTVLNLRFTIDGKEYENYLDEREMPSKEFYGLIRQGFMPATTQINVSDFVECLTKFVKEDKDVFVMCFDSKLSGTYNSLCVATNIVKEEYPDAKIIPFDTLSASTGEGLFVYEAALRKKQGYTIDQLHEWCLANRCRVNHWFTVDDIDHLKRGGRLTNAAAFAAKLLKIKPFLICDDEGRLRVKKKCIGRKKAILELYEKFIENYDENTSCLIISHGDCYDEAKELADKIMNESGKKINKLMINYIGPVIGAHSGPGTIAIFYMGLKDTREY